MRKPILTETIENQLSVLRADLIQGSGSVEAQVTRLLRKCGISAKRKGYAYLRSAVLLAVNDPSLLNTLLTGLYPKIAKQYQTTPTGVERSIRTALDDAWKRGDPDTVRLFSRQNANDSARKPTNGEFLSLVTDTILVTQRSNGNA